MTTFKLPKGYSFEPPADHPSVQGVLIPGERLYGGADISDAWDALGTHWTFCLATGPDGLFRYRAFAKKQDETAYTERPLPDSVDGRGNADVQWWDGKAHYSAWMGAQFYQNVVPGFAAFPSIPALQAQIDALKAGGGMPRAAIPIPVGSPIAALYAGTYKPSDLDTPEEVALRVSKQLAAIHQLVDLLVSAGVLSRE